MKFRKKIILILIGCLGLIGGLYQNCSAPGGSGQLELGSEEEDVTPTPYPPVPSPSASASPSPTPGGTHTCSATAEFIKGTGTSGTALLWHGYINAYYNNVSSLDDCRVRVESIFNACICQTSCQGVTFNGNKPNAWRAGDSGSTGGTIPIVYDGVNVYPPANGTVVRWAGGQYSNLCP
ncbi:MAG: hypothetical protein IT289_05355 [Oligoflexia bacterium]|nr:hypothetical protein [Oligoflexia bacterium]